MEIRVENLNECGEKTSLDKSVISLLQILLPRQKVGDDGPLSYKNCDSFELLFDKRNPTIIYYLGQYNYNPDVTPTHIYNSLNFEGTTIGGGSDLIESYHACEAIKQWAENTMELIGQKCVDENHTSDWAKVNADILKDMEKLGWNINNKTQDNENN